MSGLVKVSSVAEIFNGKTPAKSEQRDKGHPVLKIRDVDEFCRFRGVFESFVDYSFAAKHRGRHVNVGDTLILNAAHNASYVGSKTYLANSETAGALTTGEWLIIRCNSQHVDPAFMNYWIRSPGAREAIKFIVKGIHLYPKDVAELMMPLPSLAVQRRFGDILFRAESIVRLRRDAQRKAAELVPAIFLEMFGDPFLNPKGWPIVPLCQVADVQGGLQVTTKRAPLPLEAPYLRVANVYRSRLDLREIKSIHLTAAELQRTRLLVGDLLFVEGHGNPLEVGRCAVWDGSIDGCTHQNHLIRARPYQTKLLPEFACASLNSVSGRRTLVDTGKTTSGLSTISSQNVKQAKLMLPPLSLQKLFKQRANDAGSIAAQ